MTTRILLRRGNASTWSSSNPVLSTGELGFETDTYRFKIGDGQKNWANLSYFYPNVNNTSNVSEGVNLYFTNARVQSFIENLEYSIVPKDDEVVSLGTPSKKFANLYLSGNTLVLGSATIKSAADGTISISSSNANVSGFISLSSNGYIASSNTSFDTSNLATITHVSNEIANLINAAPSALDTLNELAGALGNDASFSTTVVNALSNKANTASLTTANVSELNNLYFTNARVYANVSPILDIKANVSDLTTSNVSELNNLYFTNTRVYANVSPILDLKANVSDLTSSNVSELNNLYFTNARVYANVSPILDTKANVSDLTTSNVIELNSLYFTNARVYANVSPILDTKANIADLTTSNVSEGTNLYFTDARVYANVSPILDARVYANVSPILDTKANVSDLTTANIAELNNLYYTNERAYSNISPILDSRARKAISPGTGVSYDNTTGVVSIGQSVGTSDSVEFKDLTITGNVTFAGNATTINSESISITDNMIYLNEARAENITNAVGDGANITYTVEGTHTGQVGQVIRVTGVNPSAYNIPYTTIIASTANTVTVASANTGSYVSGGNAFIKASVNPDLGFSGGYNDGTYHHTGLFRDATDGYWKFFENYGPEPDSNVYIDTSHPTFALANVSAKAFHGNIGGGSSNSLIVQSSTDQTTFVDSPVIDYTYLRYDAANGITWGSLFEANTLDTKANIADLTTSNVSEGSNLYFTNARVYANVSPILDIKANVSDLTTSNVSEGTNLYFTNARVYANVSPVLDTKANVSDLTTSNVSEGTNLYFTNARSIAALSAGTGITIESNGMIISTALGGVTSVNGANGAVILNTSNIAESGNLYYTDSRVYANIGPLLNTSNVSELNNLYFTNSRAVGALTAGTGIVIDANGLITSTAVGSSYGDSNVYSNVTTLLPSYTGNIKAGAYLDSNNRRLLIRDANSVIVWGG